jgi:hypothetical protein
MCLKMAPGKVNGSEKAGGAEEPEISVSSQSECTKGDVDAISSARGTKTLDKEIASRYQFDNRT